MAIRNDLSVEWDVSPRHVIVAAPSVSISVQDLYDTLRHLSAQPAALDDDELVAGAGKENLGGGTLVGLTITLLNASLGFAPRGGPDFVQCDILGGNLVALDAGGVPMSPVYPTAYTQVVKSASSSATLLSADFGGSTDLADYADFPEPGWTLRKALRIILAVLAGKVSGAPLEAGPATLRFRDVGDTKSRVQAVVDGLGNRTQVLVDTD